MRSRRFLTCLSALVAAVATGVPAVPALAATQASAAGPVTPVCAWPLAVNADTIVSDPSLNISNPDTASDYWIMKFTVQDGLRITLSGRYPDSRYFSFAVYAASGAPFTRNGVSSSLTDYRIAPGAGSVNPWRHRARPGGRFTVTLRSDVARGQVNVLPLAPAGTAAGTAGIIFLRVYVANEQPGRVALPAVTFTLGRVSKRVPPCKAAGRQAGPQTTAPQTAGPQTAGPQTAGPQTAGPQTAGPGLPAMPAASSGILPFARYPSGDHTPNLDTGQLQAFVVRPHNADVLVIRAKAPSTPRGASPAPWPARGVDLRYWSLCNDLVPTPTPVVVNRLPGGKVDLGCRHDTQVRLDRRGYYTFVVGTESQRAAIDRIPGATFLPFSTAHPADTYELFLRNMLANPAFAQAAQKVPANLKPASAAAVMGPYYPRAAFCPLATLARAGPGACIKGAS